MCPYFSLWHVSCVLESCVYRYALECVFVYLSWFILSCKILIMWYMQPPPPGFWCVVLVYTCYTSVVHLRCFTLPDVCRYPPVDGPDLFYISGCHWRQVVHKTLDRRGRIWGCLKKKMAEKSQAVDSTFNNYFEGRLDGHQFIPVISILNIFWP